MSRPIVNNLSAMEVAYQATQQPAVKINCDIKDVNVGDTCNVTKFQYVKASDIQGYTTNDTTYLGNWDINNAYQDELYVKLTRQGSTDSYTVEIFNDSSETDLLASGLGDINTTISITSSNDSGISGSVDKNSNQLANDGTDSTTLSNNTIWLPATNPYLATTVTGTQGFTDLLTNTNDPGRPYSFYWDIMEDLPEEVSEDYYFRLQVTELNSPGDSSFMKGVGAFSIVKQKPNVSVDFDEYTNQRTYRFEMNITNGVVQYRAAETLFELQSKAWSSIIEDDGKKYGSINFNTATQEQKTVYIEVADSFYNRSDIISDVITYHTDAPTKLYLSILGTVGNSDYTGVIIDPKDGSFELSDKVTLTLYAADLTDITMYIDGDIKDAPNVRNWIPYSTSEIVLLSGDFVGNDTDNNIVVTFKDEAGNTSSITSTIRYNTKIYRFGTKETEYYKNLRKNSAEYDHTIMEVSGSGNNIILSRTEGSSGQFNRAWDDIFYPNSHNYPRLADGTIDEAAAIAMNEVSNETYDAVDLSGGAVNYDSEGRVTTVDWTKNGTKDYLNLESSFEGGFRYFIISNEGYGDFNLEFEYFYLDQNSFGPPYNNMSPYDGDCLVIYDASAPGAVEATSGPFGKTEYTLVDATKLEELQAYTGKGDQVYSLNTGRSMNANTNGHFTSDDITTTSLICIVLYTDAASTASGFKIKGGLKHEIVWHNFHVDEENGELWIHKYPIGNAPTTEVRAMFDYYDAKVTVDYEEGTVTFDTEPSGTITADYSYYSYTADERPETRMFAAYHDDFVDFLDIDLYVDPSGVEPDKTQVYIHDYPDAIHSEGKVTQNFTVDKDRGIIEFASASGTYGDEFGFIPKGRLFADYRHHTYMRLSNDGFGDFTFVDETLVGDDTPQFPDYTFGDVKIVNEGDAILENGRMKFLPRGYDNDGDGEVDQVLDINRPWDIQHGTPAETYEKCAVEIKANYIWNPTCSKQEAINILRDWQGKEFGFDVFPQQIIYGRIVWVLGGTGSGTNYPITTSGKKVFSSEIEGKFYSIET